MCDFLYLLIKSLIMEFNDLDEDCLFLILQSEILTADDLENLQKTCRILNYLIIKYDLIPTRCKTTYFMCGPYNVITKFKCNRYQCCKYYISKYWNNNTKMMCYVLRTAVWNRWYDLVEIIMASDLVNMINRDDNKEIRLCNSFTVAITIRYGDFKMLNLLLPRFQPVEYIKTNTAILFSVIWRILYFNNFDMYNYFIKLNVFSDEILETITINSASLRCCNSKITPVPKCCNSIMMNFRCGIGCSQDFMCKHCPNTMQLENLGYLIKYYCEHINVEYAKNKDYSGLKTLFPEYYDTLMSRIDV